MDIFATHRGFGLSIAMPGRVGIRYGKDGALNLKATKDTPAMITVMTEAGCFVEVLDKAGKLVSEGGDGEMIVVEMPKRAERTLKFKKMPKPDLTKAKRVKVTRYVVSGSPYDLGVPRSLSKAIKWMQGKLAEVPVDARRTAEIDFGERRSYGESYENIAITYQSPETDEEMTLRLQVGQARAANVAKRERDTLERLKAKYDA